MNWLRARFLHEGPGIPKDAPKKHGLALFGQIVVREAWDMFKLNLLIVVFSLPIITIPATHAAATRICISMVRDENTYLWRDFWQAFRRYGAAATAWGGVSVVMLGVSGYAAFIYGQLAVIHLAFAAAATLCTAIWMVTWLLTAHLFVLLVERPEVSAGNRARLTLLAAVTRPWPILAAFGFIAALWLLHVLFYPVSIFMPATFIFSLSTLAVTFSALKGSDQVLQRHTEASHP